MMMYGSDGEDASLRLPAECLARMLQYCDVRSLGRACVVARHWRAEADRRHMWRQVCRKVYPSLFQDRPMQGEGEQEDATARRFLPTTHTRTTDAYRSLLHLRSYVLAKKLVRWDQQDQEAWAYGVVYVDVNTFDGHTSSVGGTVGSLVLKGLPRTHREGMLRYHRVTHQAAASLTPPRLFSSLEEIPSYLQALPLHCSAIMMTHPPAGMNDEEAGWWYPSSSGSTEALPLVHGASVARTLERVWVPSMNTDPLPHVHKQGLEMVVEVVDSRPFLPRFLSWPQPLTGMLHFYFGVEKMTGGLGVRLVGMRFFKEG